MRGAGWRSCPAAPILSFDVVILAMPIMGVFAGELSPPTPLGVPFPTAPPLGEGVLGGFSPPLGEAVLGGFSPPDGGGWSGVSSAETSAELSARFQTRTSLIVPSKLTFEQDG